MDDSVDQVKSDPQAEARAADPAEDKDQLTDEELKDVAGGNWKPPPPPASGG